MEFDQLLSFFKKLDYARRKYPVHVSFTKHLQKIKEQENTKKQNEELELFKRFLIANPDIDNNIITCHDFKTGKGIVLDMNNFITPSHQDVFWNEIKNINKCLFPHGKPDNTTDSAVSNSTDALLKKFQNNKLLSDALDQVKGVDIQNINSIDDLLQSEEFQKIVKNISSNFTSGKYTSSDLSDLTSSVSTIIQEFPPEFLDETTREKMSVVSEAIKCMENKEQVDVNKLIKVISSINVPPYRK